MTRRSHRWLIKYGVSIAIVGGAMALRQLFSPLLGSGLTYITFSPAVMLSAMLGGFGPGILATLLAAIAAAFSFIPPYGQLLPLTMPDLVGLALFLVTGVLMSAVAGLYHRANWRVLAFEKAEAARVAETALRASEARLRATFDNAGVGILEVEADNRFVAANERACEMLGYTREELLRMTIRDLTAPEDREYSDRVNAEARSGQRDRIIYEKRYIRKDGSRLWAHVSVSVIRDADGQWLRSIATIEDISERKRSEEALRASEVRFRTLFENTPARITVVDPETLNIVLVNPAAAAGLGYTPAELTRLHMTDVEAMHDLKQIEANVRRLAQGAAMTFEAKHRTKSGEIRDMLLHACGIEIGGRNLAMAMSIDITDSKRAEEKLRESELRYRTLFDSIDEAFCVIEMIFDENNRPIDYRFIETNPSFARHTGFVAARGKTFRELVTDPEEWWIETYGRIALTGQAARFQNQARSLNRWYDVYAFRFGRPEDRQVAVIFNDITASKRTQEELESAKNASERAKAAAEEASRAKDHFLAVLSHELRTPLTPVLTTASMLERDRQLPDHYRPDIAMIRRNVELEARLIDDLLDVTRIARGKVELDRRPICVVDVIRRAVEVCREDIEARKLNFEFKADGCNTCLICADAARLQQVFWNLLKNAVKFTPHGGSLAIRCRQEQRNIVVEVIDNGEGIDPAVLPHIFNPFEQGGTRVTRQFGGLGLGLTITRGLVEMHGGSIAAFSDGKGKGATFRVTLPLHSQLPITRLGATPIDTRKRGEPFKSPAGPLRILLVEDHGDTARIMRRLLMAEGHEAEIAGDVATALELAETGGAFDLLLSDLGLPDGSGVDLMRELRRRGHAMPGIALSGYGQEEDILRAREAGFAIHLTKPTSLERLTEAIAAVTTATSAPAAP